MYILVESFEDLFKNFSKELNKKFSSSHSSKKITIALCGGRSIRPFCKFLLEEFKYFPIDLRERLNFILTDERIAYENSGELNFTQLQGDFFQPAFSAGFLNKNQVLPLDLSLKNSGDVCEDYNEKTKNLKLFAAILGAGEDGHIASLFPNHPDYISQKSSRDKYIVINNSPKPPPVRLSASPLFLSKAEFVGMLFVGNSKKIAFENFVNGSKDHITQPANLFRDSNKTVVLRSP